MSLSFLNGRVYIRIKRYGYYIEFLNADITLRCLRGLGMNEFIWGGYYSIATASVHGIC